MPLPPPPIFPISTFQGGHVEEKDFLVKLNVIVEDWFQNFLKVITDQSFAIPALSVYRLLHFDLPWRSLLSCSHVCGKISQCEKQS